MIPSIGNTCTYGRISAGMQICCRRRPRSAPASPWALRCIQRVGGHAPRLVCLEVLRKRRRECGQQMTPASLRGRHGRNLDGCRAADLRWSPDVQTRRGRQPGEPRRACARGSRWSGPPETGRTPPASRHRVNVQLAAANRAKRESAIAVPEYLKTGDQVLPCGGQGCHGRRSGLAAPVRDQCSRELAPDHAPALGRSARLSRSDLGKPRLEDPEVARKRRRGIEIQDLADDLNGARRSASLHPLRQTRHDQQGANTSARVHLGLSHGILLAGWSEQAKTGTDRR